MRIDGEKLVQLAARECSARSPEELRREQNVFFVGADLPERETLETLYESHFQSNASLFHLTFGDRDAFPKGEAMARTIKKNFNAHLMGRLEFAAPTHVIERAYAAGVDLLDFPLPGSGTVPRAELFRALEDARAVFPRWAVVSTLVAGEEPASAVLEQIDALLAVEVVPLVVLSRRAAHLAKEELHRIYSHLQHGWRAHKVAIKPLLPLIYATSPLAPAAAPGVLRGFIDKIEERRLLATSDLRRVLRVKEVEESFASSGL